MASQSRDQQLNMLQGGRKRLQAMKKTVARPTTSPAGKKTLAEMIVAQSQLNDRLEKMMLAGRPANASPA